MVVSILTLSGTLVIDNFQDSHTAFEIPVSKAETDGATQNKLTKTINVSEMEKSKYGFSFHSNQN